MTYKNIWLLSRGKATLICIKGKTHKMNYVNGNVILRYLSQQCSSDERKELKQWLGESPQNQNTFNYLKSMLGQLAN